jgi:flagellar hook-associated protein 3 FlgL
VRVTDSSLQAALLRRIQQGYGELARASEAIASGRRMRTGSDDPVAAAELRRVEAQRTAMAAAADRAARVTGPLQTAEAALGEGSDALLRAYELAIQAGNGALGASERAAMAGEVRQLRASLLSVANTQFDGRHVFGGRAEDRAPFDAAGAFVGDGGAREVELLPGLRVEATVAADAAFAGAGGGTDVFATLAALEAALSANDTPAFAGLAEGLLAGRDQLTALRADLGARLGTVDRATTFAGRLEDGLVAQRRDLVDTDVAAAASALAQAETTLQAAVSVSKRLMDPAVLRMLM